MLDCQCFLHASEGPVIIMHQLKSVYNIPFLDSYSHPIHTCLSMIASNDYFRGICKKSRDYNFHYYLFSVWTIK